MKLTFEKVCIILEKAKTLTKPDSTHPTADEIFNYSPTGELFMIWEWWFQTRVGLLLKAIVESDGLLTSSDPMAIIREIKLGRDPE